MKKILSIITIFLLTACSNTSMQKTPNELLLSIKDYSCVMQISYFSNKNKTEYHATQNYSSTGQYNMEFLDNENLKISYSNSNLTLTSSLLEKNLELINYKDLNQNPLFLSYFINTYFNSEESNNITIVENSVHIILPNHSNYLHSAELMFKNNLPYSLTYFDENGNAKVNIIYSEFTFI